MYRVCLRIGGFITKGTTRAAAHALVDHLGRERYAVFNTWTRTESHPRPHEH